MTAIEPLRITTRAEWRSWLSEWHRIEQSVWLLYYKKHTGRPTLSYDDAVEEALCFGWIDSQVRTLDDESYMQKFSPRKPGSNWSESNKLRVSRLLVAGLMEPAGLACIDSELMGQIKTGERSASPRSKPVAAKTAAVKRKNSTVPKREAGNTADS